MRGVPDHSKEQPSVPASPTITVLSPNLVVKDPMPDDLAAFGREVLELVPRKQRASLDSYRQAAQALSRVLKITGVRVRPKVLYYAALRVKWIAENTAD